MDPWGPWAHFRTPGLPRGPLAWAALVLQAHVGDPQGSPREIQETPGEPRRNPGTPRVAQGNPRGPQGNHRGPQGSPWDLGDTQETLGDPGDPRDWIHDFFNFLKHVGFCQQESILLVSLHSPARLSSCKPTSGV